MADFGPGTDVLPGTDAIAPAVMTAEMETLHSERNTKASLQRLKASRLRINAMLREAGLDPTPAPIPAPTPSPSPSPSSTPAKLLSVAEAAEYSGLSTKRIRHLVNTEQVRCVRYSKAPNSHIKVVRASLDEWIDEQSR